MLPSQRTAMFALLGRRLVYSVGLLAAVAFISFCFVDWAPGRDDPALLLDPHYSAATVAALRARSGVDRPLLVKFTSWARAAASGDLGVSAEYGMPVAPLVFTRALRTLLLGGLATGFAWLLALPLGVWTASRAGSRADRALAGATSTLLAIPEPVLALALMAVALRTGVAPGGGMLSPRGDPGAAAFWSTAIDIAHHLALPTTVLTLGLLPGLVRHVRAALTGTLGSGFVTAARARGVPQRRLLFRSALRPAAAPLVSLLGLSIANLLSMSLLVEVLTGWPGLGPLLVEAARARDVAVVAGVALCSSLLLATAGFAADVAGRVVDPRVRFSSVECAE